MSTNAQQKLDTLGFWNKHGLDATRDAYKVIRSTLYRWRKSYAACERTSRTWERTSCTRHCNHEARTAG